MPKTYPIPQPLPRQAGKGSFAFPSPILGEGRPLRSKGQDEGKTQAEILNSILSRRFRPSQNTPLSLQCLQEYRAR